MKPTTAKTAKSTTVPPVIAKEHPGETRRGQDGLMYESRIQANGVYRWFKRASPAHQASTASRKSSAMASKVGERQASTASRKSSASSKSAGTQAKLTSASPKHPYHKLPNDVFNLIDKKLSLEDRAHMARASHVFRRERSIVAVHLNEFDERFEAFMKALRTYNKSHVPHASENYRSSKIWADFKVLQRNSHPLKLHVPPVNVRQSNNSTSADYKAFSVTKEDEISPGFMFPSKVKTYGTETKFSTAMINTGTTMRGIQGDLYFVHPLRLIPLNGKLPEFIPLVDRPMIDKVITAFNRFLELA
jgi:hypothetical protein